MDYEATMFGVFLALVAIPAVGWVWIELMAHLTRTAADVYIESRRKLLRG